MELDPPELPIVLEPPDPLWPLIDPEPLVPEPLWLPVLDPVVSVPIEPGFEPVEPLPDCEPVLEPVCELPVPDPVLVLLEPLWAAAMPTVNRAAVAIASRRFCILKTPFAC